MVKIVSDTLLAGCPFLSLFTKSSVLTAFPDALELSSLAVFAIEVTLLLAISTAKAERVANVCILSSLGELSTDKDQNASDLNEGLLRMFVDC